MTFGSGRGLLARTVVRSAVICAATTEDPGVLVVSALAQHVGHGLRMGKALAGRPANVVVGVDEEGDGMSPVAIQSDDGTGWPEPSGHPVR
jgi:hypothetical protein